VVLLGKEIEQVVLLESPLPEANVVIHPRTFSS